MLTATRRHEFAGSEPCHTLPERLLAVSAVRPASEALVDGDVRLTFADLLARAESFAGGLQAEGLAPGGVVLIQLPNWWEAVVSMWGTWIAGGVVVPVVPIYRAHELSFIIDQLDPDVLVVPQTYRGYDHAEQVRQLTAGGRSRRVVDVRSSDGRSDDGFADVAGPLLGVSTAAPDDIALVLYTSGTTSSPKGALHSHRTLLAESASIVTACRLDITDRVFMPSPLSHITGVSYAVVLPADLGVPTVLLDRWDPATAVEVVEKEGCTFTVSATPFLRGLADVYAASEQATSTLKTFICGGADIPGDLVRRAHSVMGTAVVRTYGSTEMPTVAMADPGGDLDAAADSEGRAIGGNQMMVRPDAEGVGELLVRGPELFLGYVDGSLNAASFTDDGWFRTGDVADLDPAGALRIAGRIKDVINRGGEKYSAAEVEHVLLGHPGVAEIAIVGYPDPDLGERACAIVVPTALGPPALEELRDHLLAAGFAVQKSPERLEVVDHLARTATGKIQKFRLREALGWSPSPTQTEVSDDRE